MDVKQAVGLAKQHVADLFAAEGVADLGLEEVEFDDAQHRWYITVGFRRSWDPAFAGVALTNRTYKVVTLNDDGRVLSVKNREVVNAA